MHCALPHGTSLPLGFRTYTVLSRLGEGAFGCVYYCHDASGSKAAIKIFHPTAEKAAMREAQLLTASQGDGMVRLLGCGRFRGHACIAMEEMLCDTYRVLTQQRTRGKAGLGLPSFRWLSRQLVAAVQGLHAKGVLHGDIKPENILISRKPYHLKLADLSSARQVGPACIQGIRTTRPYRSPAQQLGLRYGTEDDMWGLACVLHELLTDTLLLEGRDDDEQLALTVGLLGLPSPALIGDMPADLREKFFRPTSPGAWAFAPSLRPVRAPVAALRPVLDGLLRYENRLTAAQLAQHPFWS
jgi:serine/threonine protein kinase